MLFTIVALFLCCCPEYKKKIGFSGQLLIEPKPKEPMKHQYDYGEKPHIMIALLVYIAYC